MLTDDGHVRIEVPRDRDGSFEPQLIGKHQTPLHGFDEKIIAMYARGMTVREIQGHLAEIYGTEVSPDLISGSPTRCSTRSRDWQSRPLEPIYPVVFFDALRVKIRDEGMVQEQGGLPRPGRSTATARGRCWASGSSRPRAPSSGSRSSTS